MKIVPESEIHKLLREKKITPESFNKSFSSLKKLEEDTDDKRLEAIAKQTMAIEKLSVLLEQSLMSKQPEIPLSILQKLSEDKDSGIGNLGVVLKEHFEKLTKMFADSKPVEQSVRLPGKWKFNVHRDLQGRIETVEAESEEN